MLFAFCLLIEYEQGWSFNVKLMFMAKECFQVLYCQHLASGNLTKKREKETSFYSFCNQHFGCTNNLLQLIQLRLLIIAKILSSSKTLSSSRIYPILF